jgi:uncharacterized protein (UPF0335 family)
MGGMSDRSNAPPDESLSAMFERIVRLETERRETADAIAEVYEEAGKAGHSVAALRIVVKRHFETEDRRRARAQTEELAALMAHRLGEWEGTPLGSTVRGGV